MGMDQYLLIPFLGGWTSIYQLFWCSPGVQGFDTLPDGNNPNTETWSCWIGLLQLGWDFSISPGFGTIMLGLLATWRATALALWKFHIDILTGWWWLSLGVETTRVQPWFFCPFEKGLEDILQIVEHDFNWFQYISIFSPILWCLVRHQHLGSKVEGPNLRRFGSEF